jgi:hypothetical protein
MGLQAVSGGACLDDDIRRQLFFDDDQTKLDEFRDDTKKTLDGFSDTMKDAVTTPIKPASLVGKAIKWIAKKICKETDPGEKTH